MALCVALLRGINVGGHRRVSMADVRAALAEAGLPGATTYLQSGNVIVEAGRRGTDAVERAVERALRDALGLDVCVVARSAAQLRDVTAGNPLLRRHGDAAGLHVGFLKSRPTAAAARALADADFGKEEFQLEGTELFLRYPDGMGRSKMTAAFFERTLGTPLTVRNWKVVTKLAELAAAEPSL